MAQQPKHKPSSQVKKRDSVEEEDDADFSVDDFDQEDSRVEHGILNSVSMYNTGKQTFLQGLKHAPTMKENPQVHMLA